MAVATILETETTLPVEVVTEGATTTRVVMDHAVRYPPYDLPTIAAMAMGVGVEMGLAIFGRI